MGVVTHVLRTDTWDFSATWEGEKPFQVRMEDRGYQRGHAVELVEYDARGACSCDTARCTLKGCDRASGRVIRARIGWVEAFTRGRGAQPGFNGNGYVVLGLVDQARIDGRPLPSSDSVAGVVPDDAPAATTPALSATSATGPTGRGDGASPVTPAAMPSRMHGGKSLPIPTGARR